MKTTKLPFFMNNTLGTEHNNNSQRSNATTKNNSKNTKTVNMSKTSQEQDLILSKKKSSQKQAMRVLLKAFQGEQKIDSSLDEKRANISKIQENSANALTELQNIKDKITQLQESFGVADSSQEQSDLELLLKNRASNQPFSNVRLTSAESTRLSEIFKAGTLTDYQTQALKIDISADIYRKELLTNQKEINDETSSITSIKLERLKTHVIADAETIKESLEDKSSKEILGMLFAESKDYMDQERKEEQKIADKKAEEKKTEEENLKNDENDSNEKTSTDSATSDTNAPQVQNEIEQKDFNKKMFDLEVKKVMTQEKLLEEDIKGLTIDQEC